MTTILLVLAAITYGAVGLVCAFQYGMITPHHRTWQLVVVILIGPAALALAAIGSCVVALVGWLRRAR